MIIFQKHFRIKVGDKNTERWCFYHLILIQSCLQNRSLLEYQRKNWNITCVIDI